LNFPDPGKQPDMEMHRARKPNRMSIFLLFNAKHLLNIPKVQKYYLFGITSQYPQPAPPPSHSPTDCRECGGRGRIRGMKNGTDSASQKPPTNQRAGAAILIGLLVGMIFFVGVSTFQFQGNTSHGYGPGFRLLGALIAGAKAMSLGFVIGFITGFGNPELCRPVTKGITFGLLFGMVFDFSIFANDASHGFQLTFIGLAIGAVLGIFLEMKQKPVPASNEKSPPNPAP